MPVFSVRPTLSHNLLGPICHFDQVERVESSTKSLERQRKKSIPHSLKNLDFLSGVG